MLLDHWQRLTHGSVPVYVHPERPDWFVPSPEADLLLQQGAGDAPGRQLAWCQLLAQLDSGPVPPHPGRGAVLSLNRLKECWFHLTDRCNLACRHCLFGASPAQAASLAPELLRQGIDEARALGCSLFCFTGGEPFLYPHFCELLAGLLVEPATHAVVLTNGLLIEEHLAALGALPRERLHLQLSLDGLPAEHEALRGPGTFARLLASLRLLREHNLGVTLSVAVNRANVHQLAEIVALAAQEGVKNLHLLWHFVRGKGSRDQFVPPAEILPELIRAQEAAERLGVAIDNMEALRGQIFTSPATRFDLSNSGWESLAVGPDGQIYPSPALVGIPDLACGPLAEGLETVWRHSPVLNAIRAASLVEHPAEQANPLGLLTGGGDLDHSYLAGKTFVGHDPYLELYSAIALWLISRQAGQYPVRPGAHLLLRMGDVRHDCPTGEAVQLTHCNCLISLADDHGHASVREFYGRAALDANPEIANPFAPEQGLALYIPEQSRSRSYGCGSPVKDAAPKEGEVLVDLGSGSGVECFMAAAEVGPAGRVFGIDMTDAMLALAEESRQSVASRLGYDNVSFTKGFLEAIPLADQTADVVISNCVINLSPDKRRTFHEIFRILKPGGRLVVSDVVTDTAVPPALRNQEQMRGECLGGAMRQVELLAMLAAAGFVGAELLKRFPYRQEGGVEFHSLTFRAMKPRTPQEVEVVYRGPLAAVVSESGRLLLKGERASLPLDEAIRLDDSFFLLDEQGAVTNLALENPCCAPPTNGLQSAGCCPPLQKEARSDCDCAPAKEPELARIIPLPVQTRPEQPPRFQTGCMVCGSTLSYCSQEQEVHCHFCGSRRRANALCVEGHFICDDCHQQDGLSVIRMLCAETKETDMLALLATLRSHPAIPMHGPEHHAMVPGIILATYRNRGGDLSREAILAGIERGSKVPGGVCGFWGNCGAAAGVGIAMSVLLDATPLTPKARQQVQEVTSRVLWEIAQIRGARCCQRESVIALREAALLSQSLLPVPLLAEAEVVCGQSLANRECLRVQCPLWHEQDAARRLP
ncbi:MAG: DUF5714 domain-containing protein [Thermodesulfobacteriota bacterium]